MLKINKTYGKNGEPLTPDSRLESPALSELLTEIAARSSEGAHE